MFGFIMPDPFAMPPMRNVPAADSTSTAYSFGFVSVVMIAFSASRWPSRDNAAAASSTPRKILSIGRYEPITPVDATRTCSVFTVSVSAVFAAHARQSSIPCSPVQAFATPLFATITEIYGDFCNCSLSNTTGAAATLFVVNMAAADAGISDAIKQKSFRSFLMPQFTPAAVKPCAAVMPPSMTRIIIPPLQQSPP